MSPHRAAIPWFIGLLLAGCHDSEPQSSPAATTASAKSTAAATATSASSPSSTAPAAAPGSEAAALSAAEFRSAIKELSEPDAEFFSDNYISNETSYLQPAAALARAAQPGGVYLGVGPEQNFTYLALTRPARAYLLDIRRDNLVLHLLYKALFDLADTRSEFLALLVARPYDKASPPGPDASLEQVFAHAERRDGTQASFDEAHRRVRGKVEDEYGIELSKRDRRVLRASHHAFFDDGLDIRFKLKEKSYRRYPALRELLAQTDPVEKKKLGFLASEQAFRFVQRMQRNNLVIPLVGNFGGDHALRALAEHLKADKLQVTAFYVSNVEQYLLQDGLWWKWTRNIDALPLSDQALFIRCYLDQGRRHPQQLTGHRTTTVLQRMNDFRATNQKKPYRSMFKLSVDTWTPPPTDGGPEAAPPSPSAGGDR